MSLEGTPTQFQANTPERRRQRAKGLTRARIRDFNAPIPFVSFFFGLLFYIGLY